MADAIDWAADYLKSTLDPPTRNPRVMEFDDDFPWEGLAAGLFQELIARGFSVPTRPPVVRIGGVQF